MEFMNSPKNITDFNSKKYSLPLIILIISWDYVRASYFFYLT